MITKLNAKAYNTYELIGLSTDEKPVDVGNGSTFCEMDTCARFMFDGAGKVWILQSGRQDQ